MQNSNNYDGPLYAPWSAVVKGRGFDPVEHRKMTKTGDVVVVDNWAQAHEIWWNKAPFLDRIEVLDKDNPPHKARSQKGFG